MAVSSALRIDLKNGVRICTACNLNSCKKMPDQRGYEGPASKPGKIRGLIDRPGVEGYAVSSWGSLTALGVSTSIRIVTIPEIKRSVHRIDSTIYRFLNRLIA